MTSKGLFFVFLCFFGGFFSQIQQLVAEVNDFHGSYSAVTSSGGGESMCLTHTSFKYMQGSIVSKMQELGTLRH